MKWTERLDQWIRFLLYVLIFWMPYSKAVIETSVLMALSLWIVKRIIGFTQLDKKERSLLNFMRALRPPHTKLTLPIFIFLGFGLISAVLSDYSAQAIKGLICKTSEWFIIYFLICESFKNRKHVNIALTVLTVTVVAVALDSFLQYYITHRDLFMGRIISAGGRATGSFEAPSSLGAIYTIALPLFIILFLDRTKPVLKRFFIFLAIFIFIWSMCLSFSRGAMLGVCMGIGFSVFVFFYHLRQKKIQAYAVLYAAGLLIIIVSKISLGESAQFGFLNRETDTRKSVWVDTFKMIKDRPFFGHGSNTYMEVFQDKYRSYSIKKYYETIEFVKHAPTYAHNCFLQIWAETGIFSLLAFLWILFKMFQDSIRQIKIFFRQHDHFLFISMGLLSGLFAFLTQSFFDTNFYSLQLSAYFWYMAGIVMVINRFTIQQEGVGQHG